MIDTLNIPLESLDSASLDDVLAAAGAEFEVQFEPVTIGDLTLEILTITHMDRYVDKLAARARDGNLELPFWAKVWPAAILLGHFQNSMPDPGEKDVLEVGAGLGLNGLVAAARGSRVVLSDIEPLSLLFAQANILKNDLQDRARVVRLDLTTDSIPEKFDYILGCEIFYIEDLYRPLVKFFLKHLKSLPQAEVILAKGFHRKAKKFFNLAEKEFLMQEKVIGYKSTDPNGDVERQLCTIHRLKPRKPLT